MLAYRHQFHAGNFADVVKHALLTRLILGMQRKDTGFLYLDTHAGIGRYDLRHPWSEKLAEHRWGIERLVAAGAGTALLQPYLDAVRAENRTKTLRFYPGSPRIAKRLLRSTDRMVLVELNREDHAQLVSVFAGARRVSVVQGDGFDALKAHLPPQERRGLILIDSAFDRAREFQRLLQALKAGVKRFAGGVFALWFPLLDDAVTQRFERDLSGAGLTKLLWTEVRVGPTGGPNLGGCGVVVVNPPYRFDAETAEILAVLQPLLAQSTAAGWAVRWLAGP
jgi:23S rRNA (adenine2030-N6)-methyltransferase